MATEVLMPQMGESIAEGTITQWLVKVGEKVERDQPLLEISTDKVDSEIPSPATGILLEIRHQVDETVPVNEILALIGEAGEEVAAATPTETAARTTETAPAAPAAASGDMTLEERLRRFSSPLVRNIAKTEGVDLTRVPGTGLHGRVTKKDILAYIESGATAAPSTAATAAATSAARAPAARPAGTFSVPAYTAGENVEIVSMSRVRQITADHMVYSKATSPHAASVFHIDMSRVATLRTKVRAKFLKEVGTKLTYMPFIFSAVARALHRYPVLNAAVDGTNIVYKKDIQLGMAVATDGGLLVPVIPHADRLNLVGLAKTANDLADRARVKKLKPEEIQGGTFTVTNPGAGSLFGIPVINQPQVAILGIGAIEKRAVVLTDEEDLDSLAVRTMAYFALSFDHRIIDGIDASGFMNEVKSILETDTWDDLKPYL